MRKHDVIGYIKKQLTKPHWRERAFGDLHLHPICCGRVLRMNDRMPFICNSCGAGQDGDWLMRPHNVFLGIGCPCCESIAGTKARFDSASHLKVYRLYAASSPSGKANVGSVRYTVTSPDGFNSNPLMKSSLNCAIRQGRIPGALEFIRQQKTKEIIEKFKGVFYKGGEISYVARDMNHTTTPGPFFCINTGARMMREPVAYSAISMHGLKALIEREIRDGETRKMWAAEAKKHKATIIGYTHILGKQVKIKYQSRTGFEKEHTYARAKETNWGQSGFKKGEKLCQAILLELFPDYDWAWNKRYQFLQYGSSKLELDGYSKTLNLAFEHQGNQHYDPQNAFDDTLEEFEERIRRDKFKVGQCEIQKITLLIVSPLPLDPAIYLGFIQDKLRSLSITFADGVTVEQIARHWKKICRNPLEKLQASVTSGLGAHRLISPELESITTVTVITYCCGQCGEMNDAEAQGFTSGKPRRFCPKCRGRENGAQRRYKGLIHWRKELSEAAFSRLFVKPGGGIFLACEKGHETGISSIDDVKDWHNNDFYYCPICNINNLNFKEGNRTTRLDSLALERDRSEFVTKIQEAGLTLTDKVFMRNNDDHSEIYAHLKCPNEHYFEIGLVELSNLCLNKFLSDRSVVPHICNECCYAGVKPESRKGTIFHRLAFLRDFHPGVQYVSGFDSTGKAMEEYWCGEYHNIAGKPHPHFFIRYQTIRTTDKAEVFRMPCYVCAVEKGKPLPSSSKTLEMIEGRMLLISEVLATYVGRPPDTPTIVLVPLEQLIDGRYISTTKTRLSFFCGVPGHESETKVADNYFNLHKGGYCKACLRTAGVKNVGTLFNWQ